MYKLFLVITLAIAFLSSSAAAQSHTTSWTDVGDAELRRDVELLKSWDIIDGPVNTWPINWSQIKAPLLEMDTLLYPPHILRAIERISYKMPTSTVRFRTGVKLSNEPLLIRGFNSAPRRDVDVSLSAEKRTNSFDTKLKVSFRAETGNSNVYLDGSYLAKSFGDWTLYGGAIERWWGPGQDNALMYSTNARPMPVIGIRRNTTKAFKTKWLGWAGPWTWDIFLARMGKERHIPKALMMGMRLGFEPFNNFEVGLSRNLQLCGRDRPCGFKTWTRALIAVGDLDNTGNTAQEPGNQMASVDFSYSHRIGDLSLRAYLQGTAEDQHIVTPFQYARLLGATLSGPYGTNGSSWHLNAEWSDSGNVLAWFFGKRRAGVIYNHSIYQTGHRYDGRTLGHSLDNDSKLVSLTATLQHAKGYTLSLALRTATINWDGSTRNIVSLTNQDYKSIELSGSNKFDFGNVSAKIGIQSKVDTLTQGLLPRFNATIQWQKEF